MLGAEDNTETLVGVIIKIMGINELVDCCQSSLILWIGTFPHDFGG